MATIKNLAALKELASKSMYLKKVWTTDPEEVYTVEEFTQVKPELAAVCGNPVVIAKESKEGRIFLKMLFPLEDGCELEAELQYGHSFDEGDELDINSVRFCVERCLGQQHIYATGDVIN